MKVVVTGGRAYVLTPDDVDFLERLAVELPISEIITGAASGADAGAEAWARSRGILVRTIPADWKKFGRAAGPIRNDALAGIAEAIIAFPGGRGTEDMMSKAQRNGLTIYESPRRNFRSRVYNRA